MLSAKDCRRGGDLGKGVHSQQAKYPITCHAQQNQCSRSMAPLLRFLQPARHSSNHPAQSSGTRHNGTLPSNRNGMRARRAETMPVRHLVVGRPAVPLSQYSLRAPLPLFFFCLLVCRSSPLTQSFHTGATMLSVLRLQQYNPPSQNVIAYRPPAPESRFANGRAVHTLHLR